MNEQMNEWDPRRKLISSGNKHRRSFPQTWTHQASQRMEGLVESPLGRFLEWCPTAPKASGAWGCKRVDQDVAYDSSCSYQRICSQDSGTTEKEGNGFRERNMPVPLLPPRQSSSPKDPEGKVEKDQGRILRHSPFLRADSILLLPITALTW